MENKYVEQDIKSLNSILNNIDKYKLDSNDKNTKKWFYLIDSIKNYILNNKKHSSYLKISMNSLVDRVSKTKDGGLYLTVNGVNGVVNKFNISYNNLQTSDLSKCFSNCLSIATSKEDEDIKTIVSGITNYPRFLYTHGYYDELRVQDPTPKLNCVIEKDGMVNDLNMYCAFSRELYKELFSFKEISRIDSINLNNDLDFYNKISKTNLSSEENLPYYLMARDDFKRKVNYAIENNIINNISSINDVVVKENLNKNKSL